MMLDDEHHVVGRVPRRRAQSERFAQHALDVISDVCLSNFARDAQTQSRVGACGWICVRCEVGGEHFRAARHHFAECAFASESTRSWKCVLALHRLCPACRWRRCWISRAQSSRSNALRQHSMTLLRVTSPRNLPSRSTTGSDSTSACVNASTACCSGSAGPEGPIVTIGATFASVVGRVLRLDPTRMTTLVGCGSAAGLAAVFNAPLTGIFFTLEVVLRDLSLRTFMPIVIAAVFAAATVQSMLGTSEPLFVASRIRAADCALGSILGYHGDPRLSAVRGSPRCSVRDSSPLFPATVLLPFFPHHFPI